MKKNLIIIVLGLLLGCSADNSRKAITNCADYLYIKKNNKSYDKWSVAKWIASGSKPKNKLEERILILKEAGFFNSEIQNYVNDLKNGKYNNDKKELENIKIAKLIYENNNKKQKEYNKRLRNFISKDLNKKLKNKKYYKYAIGCEAIRADAPRTFDARWKKPDHSYYIKVK